MDLSPLSLSLPHALSDEEHTFYDPEDDNPSPAECMRFIKKLQKVIKLHLHPEKAPYAYKSAPSSPITMSILSANGHTRPLTVESRSAYLQHGTRLLNALLAREQRHKETLVDLETEYSSKLKTATLKMKSLRKLITQQRNSIRSTRIWIEKLEISVREALRKEEQLKAQMELIEKERNAAFTVMQRKTLKWETPHHFHMISCEHFRGVGTQQKLVDISLMFPGHLRILAIAKSTIDGLSGMQPRFAAMSREIEAIHAQLDTQRIVLGEQMNLLEGLERCMKDLRLVLQVEGSHVRSRSKSPKAADRKDYFLIKQRYFEALAVQNRTKKSELNNHLNPNGNDEKISVSSETDCESLEEDVQSVLSDLQHVKSEKKTTKIELERILYCKSLFHSELAKLRLVRLP